MRNENEAATPPHNAHSPVKPRFALAACLGLTACALSSGALAQPFGSGQPTANQWSERGVFVYDDFVVDFRLRLEGSWLETKPLEDCSTARFYCSAGSTFRVAVPRQCENVEVGETWTVAGVTTTVLGREDHPLSPHRQAEVTWFLGDPAQPGVVYEYEPHNGIVALYRHNGGDYDFVAMAREGTLARFKNDRMSDGRLRVHYKALVSFDRPGVCQDR